MTNASIFVSSSIFEGFPLVIIEAMACGLPVISYACPCGPKDIITDNKDGFLIPVNNEVLFAEKISLLIENEKLRKQMGLAATTKANLYKIENIIPIWMNLFKVLLK